MLRDKAQTDGLLYSNYFYECKFYSVFVVVGEICIYSKAAVCR